MMRLILEVSSGPYKGRKIEANVGQVVRIGRTTKADVAMEDNFMSGEHFAIECALGSCRLRDLNSRNGTQLNGQIIAETDLKDGDKVYAGKTDFIVRIEDLPSTVTGPPAEQFAAKSGPVKSESQAPNRRKQSSKLRPVSGPIPLPVKATSAELGPVPVAPSPGEPVHTPTPDAAPAIPVTPNISQPPKVSSDVPAVELRTDLYPVQRESPETSSPAPPAEDIPPHLLESYRAATPEGRLIHILSNQPGSLMALVDAVHDAKLLDLIRDSKEAFHSLYRSEQNATIAPYLVALPPRSELLKQMVEKGWGHGWGVYLTSRLSLLELREFFRTSLMVTMPDGMELFSRFYDPRFFRAFLETCTAPEADKFFGPILSYFMEDERPEILLQFSRSKRGAEKKGHLLSLLG